MSVRIIISCVIVFTGTVIAADANDLDYKPGELLVRFAPKANGLQRTKAERNAILNSINGGNVKHSYKLVPGLTVVKLPEKSKVTDKLSVVKNAPGILYAEPNYKLKLLSTMPDDTYFDDLWGMHNTGQSGGTVDADIDAPEAWGIETGDNDIIVAVLDSGVDYDHPDLAENMWINPGEDHEPFGVVGPEDFDGIDDDDNDYEDDIRGWDFFAEDNNPMDILGHGTHCAGIIGAVGNNTEGVTGVCWNVQIMAVNISHYGTEDWEIFASNAIKGIDYAVENGAQVLSNSWGHTTPIQSLEDEIDAAGEAGVLFVASAGNGDFPNGTDNDTYPNYPSSYNLDNIIAVMATDRYDERSLWYMSLTSSNYGATSVDLAAPGSDILSCKPGDDYQSAGGTSMAAPYVAGACALVWARNPTLNHLEVKDVILASVDKLESLEGLCVSEGRLNLYNAIIEAGAVSFNVDDGLGPGDCVLPDDFIEYQIWYSNPITDPNEPGYLGDANDVVITDYLPDEVDFISADPNTGSYDPNGHTYTWNIGQLSPGQGGTLLLKVQVNEAAEPLSKIVNTTELTSDIAYLLETEQTQVCCYGGEVIYVDASVNAPDPNGSSWATAFDDLTDALAAASICDEVWVAEGTYTPQIMSEPNMYFDIPRHVSLLGGFWGDETESYERNWADPDNETILSGDVPGDEDLDYVLNINVEQALVDGFTITGGGVAGVYCEKSSPVILHNKITNNSTGIYCFESEQPVIKNNWLYKNNYGLYLDSPSDTAIVRNNTVADNTIAGIYMNTGQDPEISNCIIWGHPKGYDLVDCNSIYSCITDGDIGQGNIDGDPNYPPFVEDVDDYHLDPCSACIDAGYPYGNYGGERDIDDQFRLLDGNNDANAVVDMGANEYCNEGSENPADFNEDGIVETLDLAELGGAWLVDANDPDWESQYKKYDLNVDDVIHYGDFAYFAQEWLWIACWKMPDMPTEPSMFMGGGWYSGSMLMTETEPTIEEQMIAQVKEALNRFETEEVKDQTDEDTWLWFVTNLERMLKELEDSQ